MKDSNSGLGHHTPKSIIIMIIVTISILHY